MPASSNADNTVPASAALALPPAPAPAAHGRQFTRHRGGAAQAQTPNGTEAAGAEGVLQRGGHVEAERGREAGGKAKRRRGVKVERMGVWDSAMGEQPSQRRSSGRVKIEPTQAPNSKKEGKDREGVRGGGRGGAGGGKQHSTQARSGGKGGAKSKQFFRIAPGLPSSAGYRIPDDAPGKNANDFFVEAPTEFGHGLLSGRGSSLPAAVKRSPQFPVAAKAPGSAGRGGSQAPGSAGAKEPSRREILAALL